MPLSASLVGSVSTSQNMLRDYQEEAVKSIASSLAKYSRVLGWFPTASGKSAIVAEICRRFLAKDPKNRVLVLCHQKEILEQNEAWCRRVGIEDVGVYCAGLKRKEARNRVVHAARDSLGNNPLVCGLFPLVIMDEAHLFSDKEGSRYRKILDSIGAKWVVGLTGSPWRIDNGVVYGKGKPWQECVAKVEMKELFARGFLSPYVIPDGVRVPIDVSNVKKTGGDFNLAQLEAVSSSRNVVESCLDEWEKYGRDRRCTLIFCCSVVHAKMTHEIMTERGYVGNILTGETPAAERAEIMRSAKEGEYTYIVNVAVLTVGVDLPVIDCLLFLRATQSLSLWVQMLGRGLRLHPDKQNCLMLDAAGNFERLGRPESPKEPKKRGSMKQSKWTEDELREMGIDPEEMKGESPLKECPKCKTKVPVAAKKCIQCGHLFISHQATVLTQGILIPDEAENTKWAEFQVEGLSLEYGMSANDRPRTKATFLTTCGKTITEFITHSVGNEWAQREIDEKLHRIKKPVSLIRARKVDGWWRTKVLA